MKLKDIILIETPINGSNNESTINNIISLGGSLTTLMAAAASDYTSLYEEHQDNHIVKLIIYARFARWFTNNYLSSRRQRQSGIRSALSALSQYPGISNKTKSQIQKLINIKIQSMVDADGKRGTIDNFFIIARGLPSVLQSAGKDIGIDRITTVGSYLEHAVNDYDGAKNRAKKKPKSTKKSSKTTTKPSKSKAKGTQISQSEKLINDIISSIPTKSIRDDIRSKLARRDNKLQLLQQLLKQHGIE